MTMKSESKAKADDATNVLTLTSHRVVEYNHYLVRGYVVRVEEPQTYGSGL